MSHDSIKENFDDPFLENLKYYASNTLEDCKQVYGPHIELHELAWIINTQKTVNTYLRIFQTKFHSEITSAKDVKRLGDLQYTLITGCEREIPKNAKITEEHFYPNLIKSFAQHNKKLADSYIE
ncbi:MAG: hypothetical protein ACW967_10325 [Candidatus Hodarchaeales archaeon]|jgi:hypothetical protein